MRQTSNKNLSFEMPKFCPSCGGKTERLGEVARVHQRKMSCSIGAGIYPFCYKKAMNIDSLGTKLIQQLLRRTS